jgi:hypothetical protein
MREIIINCDVGISGHVKITEKSKILYDDHNTITNIGLSEICYAMLDKNKPVYYIGVGDDDSSSTSAQIKLQTQLENEKNRRSLIAREVVQEIDLNYSYKMTTEFLGDSSTNDIPNILNAGIEIKEVGLFNRLYGGEMLARIKKFPSFLMDYSSSFQSEWRLKANIQNLAVNGGVVRQASEIICNSLMKFDKNINNQNLYYNNADASDQFQFTPHPWGLNRVSLGTGTASNTLDLTDLSAPEVDYDLPPTITRLDLTGESSDLDYNPKVIIQRYIPLNKIPFIIKEAGLFNVRNVRNIDSSAVQNIRKMFSRVVLPSPILANTEAVLTWVINFKRGT